MGEDCKAAALCCRLTYPWTWLAYPDFLILHDDLSTSIYIISISNPSIFIDVFYSYKKISNETQFGMKKGINRQMSVL
jgi:hypothetical protein